MQACGTRRKKQLFKCVLLSLWCKMFASSILHLISARIRSWPQHEIVDIDSYGELPTVNRINSKRIRFSPSYRMHTSKLSRNITIKETKLAQVKFGVYFPFRRVEAINRRENWRKNYLRDLSLSQMDRVLRWIHFPSLIRSLQECLGSLDWECVSVSCLVRRQMVRLASSELMELIMRSEWPAWIINRVGNSFAFLIIKIIIIKDIIRLQIESALVSSRFDFPSQIIY